MVKAILRRYTEQGKVCGWAFCNEDRMIVFQFEGGDGQNAPADRVAIHSGDAIVYASFKVRRSQTFRDGTWVAFHALERNLENSTRITKAAICVHPLTAKHPRRILRLFQAGRLNGEHVGFFRDFVQQVSKQADQGRIKDASGVAAVLTAIVGLTEVPNDLKIQARTERTRLGFGQNSHLHEG